MSLLAAISGALAGAVVGSFLATLVIRLPRGEQAVTGRSRCDQCRRELRAIELMPILSRLWLGGRCPACRSAIDATHWHMEASGAAIGGLALAISFDGQGAALAVLGWLLLPLAWLDWRHFWLPDRLVLALAAGGLALGGLLGPPLLDRLLGGIVGWGILTLLLLAYKHVRGRDGLGRGDPKLLGAIGLWLGWMPLASVLALASILGLAIAWARGLHRADALPFGTVLAAASWLAAFALVYAPLPILS